MYYFLIHLALLVKFLDTLSAVDCFEGLKMRKRRYLVYPPPGVGNAPTKVQLIYGLGLPMEGGLIVGYVIKNNFNLPYNATFFSNPYIRYERSVYAETLSETKDNRRGRMTRWEIYKMFDSTFNIFGSGKSCLLRAICEAAGDPFNENHGIFGELLHVFLTPSTTDEEFSESGDQEYFVAESLGRRSLNDCQRFSTDCETSPLEYFTESDD